MGQAEEHIGLAANILGSCLRRSTTGMNRHAPPHPSAGSCELSPVSVSAVSPASAMGVDSLVSA